jgi:hypothetical protein
MNIKERFLAVMDSIGKQKRKYGSYGLITFGFFWLIEHLLTSGFTWDIYQSITCHGAWAGIVPIIAGFLLGARWRKPK